MTERELERKIERIYRRAAEETTAKLEEYTMQFQRLDQKWQADVASGLKTVDEYQQWQLGKIAMGKRWEALNTSLAMDILKADDEARALINGNLPEAFADGFNFASYQISSAIGDAEMNASFTIYNKDAVMNLIKNEPDLLPQLNPNSRTAELIRSGKILRWNKEKINAEVTQGILQGESMGKIAKRMQKVVGMEKNSAIRNARTATNGAHNAGKMQGFERAQELGIEVEQRWLASLDDRTRIWHRELDGQTVKLGEDFHTKDGHRIAYPCDPSGEPEMVYNCRCTIVPYLPKYGNTITLEDRNTDKLNTSYEEWKRGQPVETSPEPVRELVRR